MNRRSFFQMLLSLMGMNVLSHTDNTLRNDIAANGILNPIIIHNGEIIDGKRRYDAAIALGLTNIPCKYV